MTTAKDIMHKGAQWIPKTETLLDAAQRMGKLHVGALPVSDENERLCGIITDRDIVVKCVAQGHDPSKCTAADLVQGTPRWIDANADVGEVVEEMASHHVRRLPVIENKKLVGMISEADVALNLPEDQVHAFASRVYATPPQT
ncbi:CBS domain-containing protein [Streptomyces sp. I05A-00742]|uniref:CBS domain-containing protein n=1 Tax=Streptomyces sp. I05A-00742 TaxID=2732853 RepID=UPI0014876C17|nr:CBS domain-containing protein [Streptomyces sp. I05A-00742]